MLGRDRDADDGQRRLRSEHPGEVGRATGARDDDLDAARRGFLGVAEQAVRRPVGRDDLQFRGHAELVQDRDGVLEGREVRAAAADDAHYGPSGTPLLRHDPPSQWRAARARRARSRAMSTSAPMAATWPILRRSNTRRLS